MPICAVSVVFRETHWGQLHLRLLWGVGMDAPKHSQNKLDTYARWAEYQPATTGKKKSCKYYLKMVVLGATIPFGSYVFFKMRNKKRR